MSKLRTALATSPPHGVSNVQISQSGSCQRSGDRRPFSFQKYLSRGALPKLAKITAALLNEIDQQITDYRTKIFAAGPTVSTVSGKPLAERRCHVHCSDKPFLQIVDEFPLSNRHRLHDMETEAAGATGYRLCDRVIAADWVDFHRTHAKLDIVSPEENLRAGMSGYRISFKEPCWLPNGYAWIVG